MFYTIWRLKIHNFIKYARDEREEGGIRGEPPASAHNTENTSPVTLSPADSPRLQADLLLVIDMLDADRIRRQLLFRGFFDPGRFHQWPDLIFAQREQGQFQV